MALFMTRIYCLSWWDTGSTGTESTTLQLNFYWKYMEFTLNNCKTGTNLVKYYNLGIHNFIFFSKRKNVLSYDLHRIKRLQDVNLWIEINNHSFILVNAGIHQNSCFFESKSSVIWGLYVFLWQISSLYF